MVILGHLKILLGSTYYFCYIHLIHTVLDPMLFHALLGHSFSTVLLDYFILFA